MTANDARGPRASTIEILTPTIVEHWAVRREMPGSKVVQAGVGLKRWKGASPGRRIIVCGLAGALTNEIAPGTVAVPETVELPDGTRFDCDEQMVAALSTAARNLGFEPEMGPMLTAPRIVTGAERSAWSAKGLRIVDMEVGRLAARNVRVASIRVILDTPSRSLSRAWGRPIDLLSHPGAWLEGLWLFKAAPLYALRAAKALRLGLELLEQRASE